MILGFIHNGKEAVAIHHFKRMARLSASHAIVHVKNVRLDLISRSVLWEACHFQHIENCAGIPIAPVNKRRQD